ncbi:hypothetical protein M0R45_033901 [Rubus argutus]|uniref:Uncharacterized protein n=1 Tax=Rubus argutus TaxID=59490 RepID=A0AAW1WL14_RUBAR
MYNNVGIIGPAIPPRITDLNLNEFDRVMRINVRGTVAGIKHSAQVMMPLGSGSLLCTSSISGLMGGFGPHPYSISKFTIPGIVKSVECELCRSGIRINCISHCNASYGQENRSVLSRGDGGADYRDSEWDGRALGGGNRCSQSSGVLGL